MKTITLTKMLIGPLFAAAMLIATNGAQSQEANAIKEPVVPAIPAAAIATNPPPPPQMEEIPYHPERPSDAAIAVEGLNQVMIPLALFATIAFVVTIVIYASHRRNRQLHETIRLMVEKGQPIPNELLQDVTKIKPPSSDLNRGLRLSAIGLGLICYFAAQGDREWGMGMIPLLIGVAFLISWKIKSANKNIERN